nr:uncharacterized protein LOC127333539 [Lolium perenne]
MRLVILAIPLRGICLWLSKSTARSPFPSLTPAGNSSVLAAPVNLRCHRPPVMFLHIAAAPLRRGPGWRAAVICFTTTARSSRHRHAPPGAPLLAQYLATWFRPDVCAHRLFCLQSRQVQFVS